MEDAEGHTAIDLATLSFAALLNQAWSRFLNNADRYAEWERTTIDALLAG